MPEWRYEVLGWNKGPSSIVWYRKAFKAVKPLPGERVFLVFEGVDWDAEVWFNGKRLGRHNVVFEPFRFEVTGVLEQENTLAVRIVDGASFGEPTSFASVFMTPNASVTRYDRDRSRSLAGLKKGDNHIGNGFGIYRPVYLETTQAAMVREVLARGYPERDEAVIQVEMDVTGAAPAAVKVELLPENFEGEGFVKLIDLGGGSATPARQIVSVPMPGARLWSPATPYLYRCRVSLIGAGAQRLDAQDVLFGYRSFSMVSERAPREGLQPGTLLLNGKPVFLRGTCTQGENALAMWGEKETLLDVFLMLKAANMNALRSIQHVQFPEIRELLDRLGIMSQQDAGDSRLSSGLPASAAALARVCYNNPGVVLLSFANETEFNPAVPLSSALAVDPERIFVPISGEADDACAGWPEPIRNASIHRQQGCMGQAPLTGGAGTGAR